MALTSIIIPSAGLFRHNEPLWALLAAAKSSYPFEVIIPCYGEPSPRLATRLAQLSITHRFIRVGEKPPRVGELFHFGTCMAIGDAVVWLHDDAIPCGSLSEFLRELTHFELGQAVRAPEISDPSSPHHAGREIAPWSTRYLDRACIAFPRALYAELGLNVSSFAIEGYQIAVQAAAAKSGFTSAICKARLIHAGGSTLINLPAQDYARCYADDTKATARALSTWVEHEQRPAVPRIIPAGIRKDIDFFFEDSGFADVAEAVNSFDQQDFRYRGETFGRVTAGDRYTIPPLMDVYDVALVQSMGIGDTMMHSAACYHFKQLYPDVRIRVFCPPHVEYVAIRLPAAFDQVIRLEKGQEFPSSARVWNVANGVEGTGIFGFEQLGITRIPISDRRMAPYTRRSIEYPVLPGGPRRIGIQLHGGWQSKRYAHTDELADAILELGYTPVLFGTHDLPLSGRHAWVKTPSLDDLASCLLQLDAWIGFDSGASFIANSLGIPTYWLYASHNPGGLIEAVGASAPYQTIWPAKPSECARRLGKSCRPSLGGAFFGWGVCGARTPKPGADCLDELDPRFLASEVVNLAARFTRR